MAETIQETLQQRRQRIREQITHVRLIYNHQQRRRREQASSVPSHAPAPDLLSRLPQPEYATDPDQLLSPGHVVLRDDDWKLSFYVACDDGNLDEVASTIQSQSPNQAVRQFGLEVASFANRPVVTRYLLEHGTALHGNVFDRSQPLPSERSVAATSYVYGRSSNVFRAHPQEGVALVGLLEVFIAAGWHPNQPWSAPTSGLPKVPFSYSSCIRNRPLARFLLSRGANPNLGPPLSQAVTASMAAGVVGEDISLEHTSTLTFELAIWTWDPEFLAELLAYGVDVAQAGPLFTLVQPMALQRFRANSITSASTAPLPVGASREQARSADSAFTSFTDRRATAEYLFSLPGVDVNAVKARPYRHLLNHPAGYTEEETALTLASAAQDWDYVEWLLEKGADPGLLGGKALRPQSWQAPYLPANDPAVLRQLVHKVEVKRREKE